jgi:LacI family transcriptional regulator
MLQAFVLMGDVRVPDDIALIGYDDIDFARSAVVPLSSIRQPSALIGTSAVDLLISNSDRDQEAQHIVFRPELVTRDSTSSAVDAQ